MHAHAHNIHSYTHSRSVSLSGQRDLLAAVSVKSAAVRGEPPSVYIKLKYKDTYGESQGENDDYNDRLSFLQFLL